MSAGRSPSGVASLRARFEQNANTSESPTPSRGRSPAGSVASDTSRPLSKVRTSFISVGEQSGQMSHLAEEKDGGGGGGAPPVVGDGAQLSREDELARANGAGPTSAPRDAGIELLKVKDEKAGAGGLSNAASSSQPLDTKGEDGAAAAKDDVNLGSILKGSAFEKEEAKKAATASQKPAQGAGGKAAGKTAGAAKPSTTPAVPKPAEKTTEKPIEKEKITNGKPKESKAMEPKTQSKTEPLQPGPSKTQTAPKPEPAAAPAVKPAAVKEVEIKDEKAKQPPPPAPAPKAAANPPAAAPPVMTAPPKEPAPQTEKTPSAPAPATTPAPVAAAAATAAAATLPKDKAVKPTAAPNTATDSKVSSTGKKEVSPLERKQPETSKEISKASASTTTANPPPTRPDQKSDGPSTSSKPTTTKPTAPTATTASKPPAKTTSSQKPPPPTSGIGFTKPKPRSPTRPVKLPAHLVAQTAASAAKHGDDSHTEPHKDTPSTTAGSSSSKPTSSKPSIPPPTHTQPRKPPRMSMPAPTSSSSKAAEKEKAKPRMSVAGSSSGTGVSGSFLERMMRPTQSSAQKTHEKLDPAKHSPPRKLSGSRNVSGGGAGPRTVTGASTHKPDEHAHNDGGHGLGREKHGGATKSEIEHGEGAEEV